MRKLSLHNNPTKHSIESLDIFNIFMYPHLQSFRVLLYLAKYTTFGRFVVSDQVGPTNIGSLDLTFDASLTFLLDYGEFSQSMKLHYEKEVGPKRLET